MLGTRLQPVVVTSLGCCLGPLIASSYLIDWCIRQSMSFEFVSDGCSTRGGGLQHAPKTHASVYVARGAHEHARALHIAPNNSCAECVVTCTK